MFIITMECIYTYVLKVLKVFKQVIIILINKGYYTIIYWEVTL